MFKNLAPKVKIIIYPMLAIVVLVVLAIVFTGVFINKMSTLRSELFSLQNKRNSLADKLSVLQNTASLGITSFSEDVINALPSSNPAVLVVSHVNQKTAKYDLTLENISVRGKTDEAEEVFSSQISFKVRGALSGISSFLTELLKIAPLVRIESVFLDSDIDGSAVVTAGIRTYWASLPKSLPSIEEPVYDLTADEKELLTGLGQLEVPRVTEVSPQPRSETPKENPFENLSGI